jgi:hypothetical protein
MAHSPRITVLYGDREKALETPAEKRGFFRA